jgi:hypothetical protein
MLQNLQKYLAAVTGTVGTCFLFGVWKIMRPGHFTYPEEFTLKYLVNPVSSQKTYGRI